MAHPEAVARAVLGLSAQVAARRSAAGAAYCAAGYADAAGPWCGPAASWPLTGRLPRPRALRGRGCPGAGGAIITAPPPGDVPLPIVVPPLCAGTAGCAPEPHHDRVTTCLLYTSDAADEEDSVDLGGRRVI